MANELSWTSFEVSVLNGLKPSPIKMAKYAHLTKAPIREAVFHISVSPSRGVDGDRFEGLQILPQAEAIYEWSAQVSFELQGSPTADADREHFGVRYASEDGLDVVSFTRKWFSVSRLYPYLSWDELLPSVFRYWGTYCEIAKPTAVTRVAARFINRLELPHVDDIGEYLITVPKVPANRPISGWLSRYTVVYEDKRLDANVVQALQVPVPGQIVILLDHDVYDSRQQLDPETTAAIMERFSRIHSAKNELFFESLTEKALDPYR